MEQWPGLDAPGTSGNLGSSENPGSSENLIAIDKTITNDCNNLLDITTLSLYDDSNSYLNLFEILFIVSPILD
jgi:hypothetical protein